MKRRIIAALMALCLCIGLLPATALAAEGPEVTGEGPYNGLGTNLVYFHIGTTDIYKMAMLKDPSVTAKTDIDSVKINFTDRSRELTNTDPLDNKIYSAYWHNTLGIQAQKANPSDLVSVEISYEEKSVTLNANELRLIGDHPWSNATGLYHIQAKDSSRHIVAFYDSRDSSTGDDGIFWLYHVAIVDNNSTVTNWPKDPEYISYKFGNWSTEKEGGSQFTQATVVNADTEAFAQKLSGVDVHAGTRIRIMNENDAILTRYVELYNAENDPDITINDINRESVKIAVHGTNGSTNPDYFVSEIDHNGWEDGYYLVFNRNADEIDPDSQLHNTHVPYTEVQSIEIFASLNGSSDVQSVTINKGTACGDFSTVIDQNDMYWNFTIKAPPTAPDDEDLTDDPDVPDDTAILGKGAVTVDCVGESNHAARTDGLLPGTYSIGEVYWSGTSTEGAYYVDITDIAPGDYVAAYNDNVAEGHTLSPANQENKTITLKWVDSSWEVVSTVPVTFTVTCDDEVGDGYTLTYNYNQGGGDSTTEKANQTYAANEPADLPKTISPDIDTGDDGVVFVGWTEKPNNYTKSTPATEKPNGMVTSVIFSNADIIVHAVWAQDADNDDIPDYDEDEDFAMQNVYVYAKPIGSDVGGALTEAEKGILKEIYGLTLNTKGYCVLGKLENVLLPYASDQTWQTDCYTQYKSVIDAAFAAGKFVGYEQGKSYDSLLKALEWYNLSVSSGADGYPEAENYPSWHLDGNLNISAKYKLTYDANGGTFNGNPTFDVNNITPANPTNYKLGEETGYTAPTHDDEGTKNVLFAGWTLTDTGEEIYSVEDATAPNANIPAAVDAVDLTETKTVYALWSYDEDKDGTPDINEIIVTPADITIYTGGSDYEGGIVDEDGNKLAGSDSNGFPEPGFYITLPTALNDQLRDGGDGPVNLSDELSFIYGDPEKPTRSWTLKMYNPASDANNIAYSKYIYQLAPAEGQDPVRLLIKDAAGNEQSSDRFTFGVGTLYQEYTMTIYGGGTVETGNVQAVIGSDPYSVFVDTGDLTVRGVKGEDSTSAVVTEKPEELDKITAVAADDVTYYINDSAIPVREDSEIHLLADELADTPQALTAAAEKAINGAIEDPEYDFMYLDLVDSSNGNAYVTLDGKDTVTIHWPIPGDAKEGSAFYVVHFDGLDRDYDVTDLDDLLNNPKNPDKVQVITYTKTDDSLKVSKDGKSVSFETSTFSPFALVYEQTSTPAETVTVTFKISHGTWSDGTDSDKTVTITKGTALTAAQIPTGMKPDSGYKKPGSWDTTPNTNSKLNSNVTYTYTFTKSDDTEPENDDCILYFESNGGTEFKKIDNGKDSFRINPYSDSKYGQHIPSRPGYRFTGWYRDEDLKNRIDGTFNVYTIVTIYAGWERTSVPSMLNGDEHYAYIQGYADGTVRPNANITRAQVATIFFRLLDEDVRDDNLTTYNTFPDVDEDYWANTAISTMASLGVINGRNSGLFDPDAYITRAEFAAICARFDDSNVSGFDSFTDTFGHWAEEEIGRAAALGWIQGYDDGTFRPNQYITRAQAVTMINRVLCRLPEDEDDLLPGMSIWTDCREGDWCYLAIQEATNSHDYVTKDRVYETWTDLNRAPDWSRYE